MKKIIIIFKKTVKHLSRSFLIVLVTSLFIPAVYAEFNKGDIGLGISDLISIRGRYFLSDKTAGEVKLMYGSSILNLSLRGYKYFDRIWEIMPFIGAELDGILFLGSEGGQGFGGGVFIGGEYFLADRFSIHADVAPIYMMVNYSGAGLSGLELMINVGLNYYFSGKGSK